MVQFVAVACFFVVAARRCCVLERIQQRTAEFVDVLVGTVSVAVVVRMAMTSSFQFGSFLLWLAKSCCGGSSSVPLPGDTTTVPGASDYLQFLWRSLTIFWWRRGSEDLPLCISRETVPQNKAFCVHVQKCLECLQFVREVYRLHVFSEQFGKCSRLGIHLDSSVRARIAELFYELDLVRIFNVPARYVAMQTVLALFAATHKTGFVMDTHSTQV